MSAVVEVADDDNCRVDAAPHQYPSRIMRHDAAKLDEIEWIIEWNLELRTWNLARSRFGLSIF